MQSAPKWLFELEKRCEQSKCVLGHDINAGAPCRSCEVCPGLDLHYWRKICRTCKCRKEMHAFDNSSEPLHSQIVFSKKSPNPDVTILHLSKKPIHIEWIPPNISKENLKDYINQLGEEKIPIVGTKAAIERKQQLEFQIPPHDLNYLLCDDLSADEKKLFDKYVDNIRNNFAGQGNILRLKNYIPIVSLVSPAEWKQLLMFFKDLPKYDDVLQKYYNANEVTKELKFKKSEVQISKNKQSLEKEKEIKETEKNILNYTSTIDKDIIQMLNSLSNRDILSIHYNGDVYDHIIKAAKENNGNFIADPQLTAIEIFRREYINNPLFRQEILRFFEELQNECSKNDEGKSIDLDSLAQKFGNNSLNDDNPNDFITVPNEIHCHDCKMPLCFGEIAVKAERAQKLIWHPQCFKCSICRNLLVDLVYFFNEGEVFCGRDLAQKLQIPRCKACDELIFTKQFTVAENANFHIKHFCCFVCDEPLAGKNYIAKEHMPICIPCYETSYANTCQNCKRVISADDKGVSLDECSWHSNCFRCVNKSCKKSLLGSRFILKNNYPFCSNACVQMK